MAYNRAPFELLKNILWHYSPPTTFCCR